MAPHSRKQQSHSMKVGEAGRDCSYHRGDLDGKESRTKRGRTSPLAHDTSVASLQRALVAPHAHALPRNGPWMGRAAGGAMWIGGEGDQIGDQISQGKLA